MHSIAPAARAVSHARYSLMASFGVAGLMAFAWLARVPSIRDPLGLSTADLGMVLLAGSVGALVTVMLSAQLMRRWGSTRVMVVGSIASSLGHAFIGVAPALGSWWLLVAAITVQGMGGALSTVVVNVESGRIEIAMKRSVIPHFHAAFSAVAVLGSVVGAICSAAAVPVAVQFPVIAALGLALRLGALRTGMVLPKLPEEYAPPLPSEIRRVRRGSRLGVWLEPRTLLIGLAGFALVFVEGSAANWIPLAVVDGFGEKESVGGLVLGVFIGSQTLFRVLGTKIIDRFGRVLALRLSICAGIAGVLLFCLAPGLGLTALGGAVWGAAVALTFPILVAAMSDHPLFAPERVAALSTMSTTAGLVAPPVVGLAAGVVGVRPALLLLVVMLAISLAVSGRAAPLADRTDTLADAAGAVEAVKPAP